MKKHYIIFVFLLSFSTFLSAQDFDWRPHAAAIQPKYTLKFSPTSFIRFNEPFFQFGLEHPWKDKFYLEHQVGYMGNVGVFTNNDLKQAYGYRLRTQLRYYLNEVKHETFNLFIAGDFLFQQNFTIRNQEFSRLGGAFRERLSYENIETIGGLYGVFGVSKYLNQRLVAEVSTGLGYRGAYLFNNLPDDAVVWNTGFWGGFQSDIAKGWTNRVSFNFSIKIGYTLNFDNKK